MTTTYHAVVQRTQSTHPVTRAVQYRVSLHLQPSGTFDVLDDGRLRVQLVPVGELIYPAADWTTVETDGDLFGGI
jgi:hypothetical protein